MERLQAILAHPAFRECLALTAREEEGRIYCRHDLDHLFAVARIFYIFYLQGRAQPLPCPDQGHEAVREMVYAAALLHDIGRWRQYQDKSKDHAAESARLAGPILRECGFSAAEAEQILAAVADHRNPRAEGWGGLLYTADKISRRCRDCHLRDTCRKPGEIGDLLEQIY